MDYAAKRVNVNKTFLKYGLPFTVSIATRGTYDPSTDAYASETTVDYSVYGIFTNVKEEDQRSTLIQGGNRAILLSPLDQSGTVLPAIDREQKVTVTYDSKPLGIEIIVPVKPGGTTVMFKILLKGL